MKDRPQWWLVGATRLALLAEGVGFWVILIVITIRYGSLVLYYGGIEAVLILLGPALFPGIPAVILAFRTGVWGFSGRTQAFLLLNTVAAIITGALAFSQPDPLWYYTLIAAVTVGATLLLFLCVVRVPVTVAASAVAVAVVLACYGATYALPPNVPPAPALHFRGVLIFPTSAAGTVTPEPAGEVVMQGAWTTVTVNPGTYRYAQACNGDWDRPTWATVQVPWGAVVKARNQCPPPGTVSGDASWTPCRAAPGLNCGSRPFTRQRIGFQAASTGGVFEVMTDDAGSYTILLPPGTYTVRNNGGYMVTSEPRVITVESGGTVLLDLTFRAA